MNISAIQKLLSAFFLNVSILTICFIVIGISQLGAQTIIAGKDSNKLEEKTPKSFDFYQFSFDQIHPDTVIRGVMDTTLSSFYNYDKLLSNFNSNLGNHGSPIKSLLLNDSILTGLNYSFDNLDAFRWGITNLKFRDLSQPYASVMYFNGVQKEEGIELHISQNVRENWNIGAGYRKISSEGYYIRQRNAINNFYINQHLKSKNHRYQLIMYGLYNETYNEENGGIQDDTLFTNSIEKISRKGFPVNYQNAANRSRQQEYVLKQRFNFGPIKKYYYRNENDSLFPDSVIRTQIIPRITIEHTFLYQHQEFIYEDKDLDSINYQLVNFRNGSDIIDKTLLNKFDNEVGIIIRPWNTSDTNFLSGFRLRGSAGFQYGTYEQHSFGPLITDLFQNNTYLSASLYNLPFARNHMSIKGKLVVAGYNESDFNISAFTSNKISNTVCINLRAAFGSQRPALLFDKNASAGWEWNTSLNKMTISKVDLNLKIDSSYFKIGLAAQSITNYTYYDFQGLPSQFSGTILSVRPYIEKLFNVWKFHLKLRGGYQFIDQKGIINLPEIYTHNTFYIESKLFQSEMIIRLGSDLFYTSSFTADNYNPSTRQFYVQNSQQVGEYPWLEPYLMVNVERFFFFARMANVNEGIPNYNYLARRDYPMQDRAFKFAIKWAFIN